MQTREHLTRAPIVINGDGGGELVAADSLPSLGRLELHDLKSVRKEMGKLYREMRRGQLSTAEGCRLVFVLSSIGRLIEAGDLEMRLRALDLEQGK